MRGCCGGKAVPVSAEVSMPEQAVPLEPAAPVSAPAETIPAEPAPMESVPMDPIPMESIPATPVSPAPTESSQTGEAVLPQDRPEAGGVGLPALDTPANTVTPGSGMDQYLETNCEQGVLRIQAFRGQQAIPVEGANITVRCPIGGDEMIFFQGTTDASGVIDPILLPAPKPETSLAPGMSNPCSEYEIVAEHPEFETLTTKVMVFPGIKTIQPLQMRLKAV